MKRLKKATLLLIRHIAYRYNRLFLYYWADLELHELRSVYVMPEFYYRWLFHFCMWLVEYSNFRRLAERTIHTIPYHVRFHVA